jgi:hypothetical protein
MSLKLAEMSEKEGVQILDSGWSGEPPKKRSCVCYNMCYSEGMGDEIIYTDRSTDMRCHCYNTNYSGRLDAQTRPVVEIQKERNELKTKLPLLKRVLHGSVIDGLERKFLEQYISILEKVLR